MWWMASRTRLPPPRAPLRDYWVLALVHRDEPLLLEGERVVGYYVNLGVRSAPERVRDVVGRVVRDGTVAWQETSVSEEVAAPMADDAVRRRVTPVDGEGVWYRGGRIFFGVDG